MSSIPALGDKDRRLGQVGSQLGYTVRPCINEKTVDVAMLKENAKGLSSNPNTTKEKGERGKTGKEKGVKRKRMNEGNIYREVL